MKEARFSHEDLLRVIKYDPETGKFYRLITLSNNCKPGEIPGYIWYKKDRPDLKYMYIYVLGRRYQAHRVAFFYMTKRWPENKIDHKDHDGLNNKWDNLREATQGQNLQNARIRSDNVSGHKGVSWDSERSLWQAGISINGKRYALGRFADKEGAIRAYEDASNKHFGEFAYQARA